MNIISPIRNTNTKYKSFKQNDSNLPTYKTPPSFKGDPVATLITPADEKVLNIFKQYYGGVSDRIGKKLVRLIKSSSISDSLYSKQANILKHKARYDINKGVTSIKDKNIFTSIRENLIFPFITLPSYFGSWVLKKAQSIPSLNKKATVLRNQAIFRVPRKINDMDAMTDSLKGMYDKTKQLVETFAKEKGATAENLANKTDELLELMNKPAEQLTEKEKTLVHEAGEFIQEGLYKVSNKFFDKNTGNFNTAYERPLNRIVSGMIPVAFLANDAYNLSVLCGDKKEDSQKEAKIRTKQEISRVMMTAYIQLLTFGAFTKQVNTKPWFTPLTSAVTVLFSEITARKRLGRPIMFLSKEAAKEYNIQNKNNEKNKTNKKEKSGFITSKLNHAKKKEQTNQSPLKDMTFDIKGKEPSVFTSFKASNNNSLQEKPKSDEKKEPQKALINFKTFKKGVKILLFSGFVLSFLKNSSYTKNSEFIKGIKAIGARIKEKVYDPIAFKDFEMTEKAFKELTKNLKEVDCIKIAEGHEYIKKKYATVTDGVIKMTKSVLSDSKIPEVADSAITRLKELGRNVTDKEAKEITSAIRTAAKAESTNISERKFGAVAKKAQEILQNKGINLSEEQKTGFSDVIQETIEKMSSQKAIRMETKAKPFIDMVIQPFKFILSVAKFPFEKIAKPLIQLSTSGIEKKAQEELLGKAELNNVERAIHKVVTEIFGEKTPKSGKICQSVFANAMEQLEKQTMPYRKAKAALETAISNNRPESERNKLESIVKEEKEKLRKYVNTAVEKSFNGVTQSSNKNTDLAMMSKVASSTVTTAFLVADNYNMVMLKSDGEDKEGAKEKANERIIQRLSAMFYQAMFINWFNATFRTLYNSSLKGMTSVVIPNTLTTEILTRKSIGMPIGRKTIDELNAIDEKNENRKGFLGKYFKFMRLLTGKKPLKDRLPKDKQKAENIKNESKNLLESTTTNLLEKYTNK